MQQIPLKLSTLKQRSAILYIEEVQDKQFLKRKEKDIRLNIKKDNNINLTNQKVLQTVVLNE